MSYNAENTTQPAILTWGVKLPTQGAVAFAATKPSYSNASTAPNFPPQTVVQKLNEAIDVSTL